MRCVLLIVKNNLSKKKGDAAVLAFLILFSTLLCYISISVLTRTSLVIETVFRENNTADFFFVSSSKETEEIANVFMEQAEVEKLEQSEGILLSSGKYHTKDGAESEFSFLFEPIEKERTISVIPDIGERKQYNSILLPYYLKTAEGISTGDVFYLTIGKKEYEFRVEGFVEDPLFASPINISVYRSYLTEEFYRELLETEPDLQSFACQIYKIKLHEEAGSQDFDAKVMAALTKKVPDLANYANLGINGETMKFGAGVMSNIGMGILLVFAVLLITIALVIIHFSIKNFIDGNLKNIALLMTSGYTKRQLIGISCLEMLSISGISAGIGLVFGALLNGAVGNLETSLIGLAWNMTFDFSAAVFVFFAVNLVVLAVTYSVSRVYGRIEILEALRGGIRTHNFRKNHLSLDKTRLPKLFALGFKSVLGEKGKSAAVMGIAMLLSFACCIGFALYQNFASDNETLLNFMGVETGNIIVSGERLDEIGEKLESWESIDKVLYYDNRSVRLSCGEKKTTVTCEFWEEPEQNENTILVDGRLPEYDNEIVITSVTAKLLDVETGDVIYVEGEQGKQDYIICGIDQKMQELGMRAMMTMDGAVRLNGSKVLTYLYVFMAEGYTYEQIEKEMMEQFDGIDISDSMKSIETVLSSVKTAMFLICAVFSVLTLIIVSLIIVLLVKMKITKEWRQYGIYKAIGFTTSQLIVQTQLGNLPVILVGAVFGAVLSVYLLNPIVALCLSLFGIVKCNLSISPVWLVFTVVMITAAAAAASFLCALRLRKMEPVKMLMEE